MTYERAVKELADAAQSMLDAHEEHKPCEADLPDNYMTIPLGPDGKATLRRMRKLWAENRRQSRSWMQEALLNYEAAVRAAEMGSVR